MNNTWERRIPPRSKFNDEEATGVLRLIVEQEKLLKNATASPVLYASISPKRQKKLPPINLRSESLDENDFQNNRSRKSPSLDEPDILNKPTLFKGKDFRKSSDQHGSLPGIPSKVPDIYCSPKMARHRERPRGSYGRSHENLHADCNRKSKSLESCADLKNANNNDQRPSNPMFKEDLQNDSNTYYASSDEMSGGEEVGAIAPEPPKRTTTPTYIN
ncbi:uncharacterized protein LOC116602319 [Nematostella vectensis]|uniref:uncharacterized protein LOC116602319 n=1 Tax=Nematostella vectensis TaxID=45351 RepID=UPI0013905EC2|nr:uncharacterized protein LOC116602319 [Nematostella vectensis]XP_048586562.1 uncharacterized protein LOC116602319 [Nematostella vectensis]XP_048586563.1 uncharacterized protein LOC116602319 [Nematostella vectensis]